MLNSTTPGLTRRHLIRLGAAAASTAGLAAAGLATASPAMADANRCRADRSQLRRWARDTWSSMVAMTDETTGLPSDNIPESLAAAERSGYTSPTNIGGYLWSAVVARDLDLIDSRECDRRVATTLTTLLGLGHHEPSGMFYNWYHEATGEVLTTWPDSGDQVYPFLSSVDNAWLGAALQVVRTAVPSASDQANQLWQRMRWDMFYDPEASLPGGLIHGGFYDATPPEGSSTFTGNHIGVGSDVWYTNHHYDTTVSETRITTYLGIIRGQIPQRQYYAMWRSFPGTDDWSWQESLPVGETRTYYDLEVFEGAYSYRGMRIVPGWGGSMFEELMPDLFVPEATWAPTSWGVNHPLHVRAQREHGLEEAGYGYWGFSPASDPAGDYREYGVDALGLSSEGYFSDQEKTNYDAGYGEVREATNPTPTYGDGVVTPHASFLALAYEPAEAQENLCRIEKDLEAYGAGGFFDSVAVCSGTIARRYLALDQAMVMGALGNALADGCVRTAFATAEVESALRPVIEVEEFGAGTDGE